MQLSHRGMYSAKQIAALVYVSCADQVCWLESVSCLSCHGKMLYRIKTTFLHTYNGINEELFAHLPRFMVHMSFARTLSLSSVSIRKVGWEFLNHLEVKTWILHHSLTYKAHAMQRLF